MSCAQDASFGPASTCRTLDFTLYFEQTILSLTPDIIFLVLIFVRLRFLLYLAGRTHSFSKPSINNKLASPGYSLLSAKLFTLLLVLASSTTSLVYVIRARGEGLQLWVGGAVLQAIVTIPLAILSLTEHFASSHPSVLLITYTLIKTIFTGTALRTYNLLGLFSNHSSSRLSSNATAARGLAVSCAVVTAAYALLFCTELVEKRRLLKQKLPLVSTSSILTRSLYIWLLPLLWHGRTHTLSLADCGEIPLALGAQATRGQLESALSKAKENPRTRSSPLMTASLRAFHGAFLAPVFPRLILLLATFAQPLLVNQMIEFVSSSTSSSKERDGWALVGGFVCVYALIAVSTSVYWEKVFDATVRYRGALVGVIYTKTLRLSSAASRGLGSGVATTYMSVDVERVCEGAEFFHEMWASVASIGLSIALIYSQATWPAFLPLILTLLLLLLASLMGGRIGKRQAAWLAATDARVKFLSSVIGRFLPIKWSAYESVLAVRARKLRETEMQEARSFYYSMNYTSALSATAGTLCILSVLGPYAALASRGKVSPLDPNRLFTIVTTVNLLSTPLNLLGQFLPFMAASYASLKRIQGFLLLEEKPEDSDLLENDKSSATLSLADTAIGNEREEKDETYKGVKEIGFEIPPIKMTGSSFAWAPDATEPFLKDINVLLSDRQLYMCIGPVASGKSLFLMSTLGETTLMSGTYNPPTSVRIAYAAQDALIVPGTVRENILFGRVYDSVRYNRVLEACALQVDVGRMPNGDGTLLAEKGSRLSGGQKQRIALARAVYADAAWTLLDDPLSALDAETEEHVFESLFGEDGLLKGKAVILVTHNIKHLNAADRIIVLDSGRVLYQGKLDEIIAHGYSHALLTKPTEEDPEIVEKKSFALPIGEEHMDEQEVEEAAIAKSSRGFTPYMFFARMATWRNSGMVIVVLILCSGMRLGLQFYLREWSASDGSNLAKWAAGYAGFTVALLLTTLFSLWQFATVITVNSGKAIHAAEVKGLFATAPSFFMSTPAGRIVNRFSQDIFLVDFEFPVNFLNGIIQFITLVGTLAFIFIPAPWLTLSILPLGIMYYIALVFYLSTSKQLQHLEASSKSPLYTVFSTTLSGLETIRALKVETYFQDQNDAYLNRSQQPFYFRFGGMRFLRTLLALISFVIAVGLSALTVELRRTINPSSLGLALSSLTSFSQLLNSFLMSLANIENGSVAISRIHELVSLPPEEKPTEAKFAPKGDWPSTGNVTFEDVHMRYKSDLNDALRGVSFKVKGGQKVGICGRSGSGKSSLILALFRGLDRSLRTGKITIDGLDVEDLSLETVRKAMSLVAQDPFLWHSTLRENLDPAQELEDQDIWMALKRVGMSVAVSALPEKLDAILEDGGSFSKGQRQLLCLSRVLLRKKKIIVLDEASSSLDLQTDEQMREVIRTELSEYTVIAIAHRIATIIDFDWIIVMDDGVVAESGKPHDLLQQPDSKFARLANSQQISLDRGVEIA